MTANELDMMACFITAIEEAETKHGLYLSGMPLIVDAEGVGHGILYAKGKSEHTWGES